MKASIVCDRNDAWGCRRSGWAWDAKLDDFDNDGVRSAAGEGFIENSNQAQIQELAPA